ncbi:PAS domain S-box protein [Plectonema cf. radiosum LEGE 06105]|uniref:histidine kinase n=1 Tax=Plectonema cf. radiosum LEGE 06105 TaxID=945769 RepID=A0A8J7F1N5_9CYAN|nr:PAS domain S-box protein [Plectonema radiosum]MBE9214476.1 PAS domain S-box protein [Plectonema cf. radiosum LEGE 06105]
MTKNSITIDKNIYESLKRENKYLKDKLQHTEQILQLAIDNVPHSVFWKDRNSVYLGCNRNFAEDAGINKPEDIVGKSDYDLPWTQEEADYYREWDRQVMDNGIPQANIIETQVQADGNLFWVDTSKIPLRDNEGNVVGILGIYENITERKQVEESLKILEREQFIRSIYDGIEHNIFVIDINPDGELICVGINSFGLRMIGLSNAEVVDKSLEELFGIEAAAEIHLKCQQCIESSAAITYEESLILQGKEIWLLTTLNPIKDNQGKIYRLIGTTFNITERKQAEEKLKASQHFIQRVADSSPNILYIYDIEEQRNIYANQEVALILGYSTQQIQNWANEILFKIIHPEDLEKIMSQQRLVIAAADGDILELEYRIKDSHGDYHWLFDRQTVFSRKIDGSVKQFLGVATDITNRKLAEMEAQQKAIELEKTLQKLQQTQAQLIQTEKMSSLGQMVAGIAHEINNPVNFIHANLPFVDEYSQDLLKILNIYQKHYQNPVKEVQEEIQNIELDFIKEDLTKIIKSMEEGTRRIRAIVLSLRNFSRLDEAEFKKVDIHQGMESTLMILQNRLKAKPDFPGVEVIKQYGNLPLIECYPSQLNQVFLNILANAIDALEEEFIHHHNLIPKISIYTQKINGNTVQIRISDNGSGIPPNIISKLFDPFFTTKEVGKGTGLGLSVSYQIIVDKHAGNLSCNSILGQGTDFIIEIPVFQVKG